MNGGCLEICHRRGRPPYKSAGAVAPHLRMLVSTCVLIVCLVLMVVRLGVELQRLLRQLDDAHRTIECVTQRGRLVEAQLDERKANTLYVLRSHPEGNGPNRSLQLVCARQAAHAAFYFDANTLIQSMHEQRGPIRMMVERLALQ